MTNNGKDIFKNTPLNEDQIVMEGLDFDLNFLNDFVNQEISNGKPEYTKSKSMTLANVGSGIPVAGLNYKAYETE
jgi:hypothetical protein